MKKAKALIFLKDKRGFSITIQAVWALVGFFILLSLFLGFITQIHKVNQLDRFADEMALACATYGKCAGAEIDKRYNDLKNSTGIAPKVAYAAPYYNKTRKTVQYGESITVNLTLESKLIGWKNFYIPQVLESRSTRQSMEYWKG